MFGYVPFSRNLHTCILRNEIKQKTETDVHALVEVDMTNELLCGLVKYTLKSERAILIIRLQGLTYIIITAKHL